MILIRHNVSYKRHPEEKKGRALPIVAAFADVERWRADHEEFCDALTDVDPTVPDFAFEVKRVPLLQQVLLPLNGELDLSGEAVLKLFASMMEVAAPLAAWRHGEDNRTEPLMGEAVSQ